jgi:hypothetical protein
MSKRNFLAAAATVVATGLGLNAPVREAKGQDQECRYVTSWVEPGRGPHGGACVTIVEICDGHPSQRSVGDCWISDKKPKEPKERPLQRASIQLTQ